MSGFFKKWFFKTSLEPKVLDKPVSKYPLAELEK